MPGEFVTLRLRGPYSRHLIWLSGLFIHLQGSPFAWELFYLSLRWLWGLLRPWWGLELHSCALQAISILCQKWKSSTVFCFLASLLYSIEYLNGVSGDCVQGHPPCTGVQSLLSSDNFSPFIFLVFVMDVCQNMVSVVASSWVDASSALLSW